MTKAGIHRTSWKNWEWKYTATWQIQTWRKRQRNKAYKGICKYGKGGSYGKGDWKTSDLFRGERTDGADTIETLMQKGEIYPALVIGVPVGFVNVVEAKERIMAAKVPYIVAKGRKGGSTVAAAILNALLYKIDNER